MAQSTIPVDLFNPGQVFACLGFMELADVLLGDAAAGFDWSGEHRPRFQLSVAGDQEPVEAVLEFLANSTVEPILPLGYTKPSKNNNDAEDDDQTDIDGKKNDNDATKASEYSNVFPAKKAEALALPIRLCGLNKRSIEVSHWADGSTRNTFKLYAGNRSAEGIARAMLEGIRGKPKKNQTQGELKYKGFKQLWAERKNDFLENPFDVLTPLGGSFNFDPRGAWTALDAGYSPNMQKHAVAASPLVHLLAACGLEHTRPVESGVRKVRYCAWSGLLPITLARVAFQGGMASLPTKPFHFTLALSGKNKIVTYAQRDNAL